MQDEQIVALYWQRDEDAIAETSKKYGAYLSKIIFNIVSDSEDSQECVNDTYLRAWNSMPVNRPSVLSSYLGKIARRIAIDRFRRKNSQKRYASQYAVSLTELGDSFPDNNDTEQQIQGRLLAYTINTFLRTLPEEARDTFIGRYFYFDSIREVAAYCEMSEAKAKSMLYRTRQDLRNYLIQEGYDL